MAGNTPKRLNQFTSVCAKETRKRLGKCWSEDIDWNLYPEYLRKGCAQIGKALSIPPTAVMTSLLSVYGFFLSPSSVKVANTDWKEPVLIWGCICMPTGSGKSTLCTYISNLIKAVRERVGSKEVWEVGDSTFEKMGQLMFLNSGRIFGMYDELTTFLTQLNVYQGKGLSNSHELALFLQLYNGHSWSRNTVTGDANFDIASTNLTLGGFTQPAVARNLIENTANIEKGLSQRFMWIFPKPIYADFGTLQPIDPNFTEALVTHLSKQYKKKGEETVFQLPEEFKEFSAVYNTIQKQLETLQGRDELLCGMLSKSKGQILRVAAILHVLFQVNMEEDDTLYISTEALYAAIDFVQTSIQHTAYIANRHSISEEVELAESDNADKEDLVTDGQGYAGYTILQPGKKLDISALIKAKRFKDKGNKAGAVAACKRLESAGLGVLHELGKSRGTSMKYMFEKQAVPQDKLEKEGFIAKLSKIGVTLRSYITSFDQEEIKSTEPPPKKQRLDKDDEQETVEF